ncbi:hypothetical protein ACTG16_22785 [Aeromonas sp. 23P]|uniref:hypothetical protein n=1 Tax=Aeromonas sp. 23P TaxID=3452716 RepID=UPI003F7AE738|nr:hypothetical protein [Aeromonas veronii]
MCQQDTFKVHHVQRPIIVVSSHHSVVKTVKEALAPHIGEGQEMARLHPQKNEFVTLIYSYTKPVSTSYLADVVVSAGVQEGLFICQTADVNVPA